MAGRGGWEGGGEGCEVWAVGKGGEGWGGVGRGGGRGGVGKGGEGGQGCVEMSKRGLGLRQGVSGSAWSSIRKH